jgi:ABC-type multidrug transport system permease subunit
MVVLSLLYAIYRGVSGWMGKRPFTLADNRVRHITATIAHIQLALGYVLYFNSPLIAYFRGNYHEAIRQFDYFFFGLLHVILMSIAVIVITIGSSSAKRSVTNQGKFRIMTLLFALGLLIIFIAIPWPFSPLAHRPYLRTF